MSVVYSPAALKYTGNFPEMDSRNSLIQQQQRYQLQQQNSGLLRYRSAPSSLLTNMVESSHTCGNEREDSRRCYVPEMEGMLGSCSNSGWSNVKHEEEEERGDSVFCDAGDRQIYHSQGFQDIASGSCSSLMMNTTAMGSGNSSDLLIRQKTSPSGFFSNFSLKSGFAALGEQATTSTSGFNGALTFSSEPSSCCPTRMPRIAENGNETLEQEQEDQVEPRTCVQSRSLRNDNGSTKFSNYIPSFTSDLLESSSFTAHRTASDSNQLFSFSDALESQHANQFGYENVGLTHQMSLPNSSTKMDAIERILHIQGSVPCKIRAKRGFATHPRSIAERIRRTRISERIKKLQELFPKTDKQTSTADMLDLAVDYIKDLQKQVKILADTRAKCRCSVIQKQYSS